MENKYQSSSVMWFEDEIISKRKEKKKQSVAPRKHRMISQSRFRFMGEAYTTQEPLQTPGSWVVPGGGRGLGDHAMPGIKSSLLYAKPAIPFLAQVCSTAPFSICNSCC